MKFGVDFDVARSDVAKLRRLEILACPNIPLTLTHVNVQGSTRISRRRHVCTGCFVIASRFLHAITLIENTSDTGHKLRKIYLS